MAVFDEKEWTNVAVSSATAASVEILHPVSNGAKEQIEYQEPYIVQVTIEGACHMLFHAWNNEAIDAKATAAKNSRAKKTDDVESYVYRTEEGLLAFPSKYFRGTILGAAKFRQDPRSPRKSAVDLFKAGVVVITDMAIIKTLAEPDGAKAWDYIDMSRVRVQQNAITRHRPAFKPGWRTTFDVSVILPEYIESSVLHSVVTNAGKFVGLADYRPTYGRFNVVGWEVRKLED